MIGSVGDNDVLVPGGVPLKGTINAVPRDQQNVNGSRPMRADFAAPIMALSDISANLNDWRLSDKRNWYVSHNATSPQPESPPGCEGRTIYRGESLRSIKVAA